MRKRIISIIAISIFLSSPSLLEAQPQNVDFNQDGKVDFADFLLFAAAFGSSTPADVAKFNISNTGIVGFSDFLIFASSFGKTIPQGISTANITVKPTFEDTILTGIVNTVAKILKDDGGLVRVVITNKNASSAQLKVESGIENYTSVATKTVTISTNATDTVKLAPLLSDAQ